jgi:hypothetical protein
MDHTVRAKLLGSELLDLCDERKATAEDLQVRLTLLKNRFDCLSDCELDDFVQACDLKVVGETCNEDLNSSRFNTCLQRLATEYICGICLEPSEDENEVIPACINAHGFHKTCIQNWISAQRLRRLEPNCPTCKSQLLQSITRQSLNVDPNATYQPNHDLFEFNILDMNEEQRNEYLIGLIDNVNEEDFMSALEQIWENEEAVSPQVFYHALDRQFYFTDDNAVNSLTDGLVETSYEFLSMAVTRLKVNIVAACITELGFRGNPELIDLAINQDNPNESFEKYRIISMLVASLPDRLENINAMRRILRETPMNNEVLDLIRSWTNYH